MPLKTTAPPNLPKRKSKKENYLKIIMMKSQFKTASMTYN